MTVSAALDRRFRDTAVARGLVDVSYDFADSPVGRLFLAATPRGLCRVAFDPEPEPELEGLARRYGVRVLRSRPALDDARRQLDEYFTGRRQAFDVDLDLDVPAFHRDVLTELARVPYGRVTTYGALAHRTGRPRAARAVGTVMNRNPLPIVLPCHRVIGSTGKLVGYGGGLDRKELLLRLEGYLI
jgi:methylated-DNA-[protein]-cysteine S-methyltransferase